MSALGAYAWNHLLPLDGNYKKRLQDPSERCQANCHGPTALPNSGHAQHPSASVLLLPSVSGGYVVV